MQKPLKNYTIPTISQNPSIAAVRAEPGIPFYHSDPINKVYEVPCYSLKTRKNVDLPTLQGQIYQKPEKLTLMTYNVWF